MNNSEEESKKTSVFNDGAEFKRRKEFSHREVGITHPDNKGFFRISDSGEIEIFAAPGVGLIINPNTRSVSIYADSIKFFCREDDGLRWNDKSFNPASDVYNEPALIKTNEFLNNPAYYRSSYYLNNLLQFTQNQEQNPITIMGKYGLGLGVENQDSLQPDPRGLTFEQKNLIDSYSKTHTEDQVILLTEYLMANYSFDEAVKKIDDQDYMKAENTQNFPWMKDNLDK
jgi:hypothetical protein